MALRRGHLWFSSLWIADNAVMVREMARERPAWSTACGPLTIVCRSRLVRDSLAAALAGVDRPVDLALGANRAELGQALARFAAANRLPYVHVVAGSFDYEPQSARLLGDALARSRPPLCVTESARRRSDAYSFRGRTLCARFGFDAPSPGAAAALDMDALLVRADVFTGLLRGLMRVPPDAGWYRLALRAFLDEAPSPGLVPMMFGSVCAVDAVADASEWQSHALPLVENLVSSADGRKGSQAAAAALLSLANVLLCVRSLAAPVRSYLARRVAEQACGCIVALRKAGWLAGTGTSPLCALLCDVLGIDGPDTLEMDAQETMSFCRQQLDDFIQYTDEQGLADLVHSILHGDGPPPLAEDHQSSARRFVLRMKLRDEEMRQYRAIAALALDQLQFERQQRRSARPPLVSEQDVGD